MVISGYYFLLRFLPIFLIIYYLVQPKYRKAVLTVFSLYFYAFGEGIYVIVLFLSCIANYYFSLAINSESNNRNNTVYEKAITGLSSLTVLKTAVALNIFVLIIFKYINLFPRQPLGISFFTFRAIGSLMDIYRKDAKCPDKFIDYSSYLCAFPLVSMGPITSYKRTDFHLASINLKNSNIEEGLKTLVLGLSAKLLLADRIGILYNDVRTIGLFSVSPALAWLCAFAYSFQLYFDFAGYSLMAKGLLTMIGVSIPDNFDTPYVSLSVTEFWRRWHISLGTFFKEYVYIPLGGNRGNKLVNYRNILIVWALTALWHGLGINFMLWGLLLALLLFAEKSKLLPYLNKYPVLGHIYMFIIIPLSWALFSVTDSTELLYYMGRLLPFLSILRIPALAEMQYIEITDVISYVKDYFYLFICCILFSTPIFKNRYEKYKNHPLVIILLFVLAILCFYRITVSSANPFMYFDF